MRSFRIGPKYIKNTWVTVGTWECKYKEISGSRTTLCICCQPKNVLSPQVLKSSDPDFREYFRTWDSIGKSSTPKMSRRPHRRFEPRNSKGG